MIATITPVVYGSRKRAKWAVAALLFSTAEALGGATMGALLGGVGWLLARGRPLPGAAWWALAVGAALYALNEGGLVKLPRPSSPWQVPRGWRARFHPWRVAAGFGWLLGLGVLTHVETATFYLLVAWSVLSGSPLTSALVFAGFGLAQSLAFTVDGLRIETLDDTRSVGEWRLRWRGFVHRVNAAVLAAVGVFVALIAR